MESIQLDRCEIGPNCLELVRTPRGVECRIQRLGEVHVLSRSADAAQGRQRFLQHCANWAAAWERERRVRPC